MSKLIHLDEIRFAKQIVLEVPNALIALDKCYDLLYDVTHYEDIQRVINEMIDARLMLQVHLEAYSEFLEQNGVKK